MSPPSLDIPSPTDSSKPGQSIGPVAFNATNAIALAIGAIIGGGVSYGLTRLVHPFWSIFLFVILLVLPFHIYAETHPRRWSGYAGVVIGFLTTLVASIEHVGLGILPEAIRSRVVVAAGLFFPAVASTFIAGQLVKEPQYPSLRDSLKDWSASVGFYVALVTMVCFFTLGLEEARAWGSRLTTAFVSMGLVIIMGYRFGIICADFVLERKSLPKNGGEEAKTA